MGIDIDPKLVRVAWKNLHRCVVLYCVCVRVFNHNTHFRDYFPVMAPDGRPFPLSLTLARGPMIFPPSTAMTAVPPTTQTCVEQTADTSTSQGGSNEAGFPHNIEFINVSM